jgi:hypothetical protein
MMFAKIKVWYPFSFLIKKSIRSIQNKEGGAVRKDTISFFMRIAQANLAISHFCVFSTVSNHVIIIN